MYAHLGGPLCRERRRTFLLDVAGDGHLVPAHGAPSVAQRVLPSRSIGWLPQISAVGKAGLAPGRL